MANVIEGGAVYFQLTNLLTQLNSYFEAKEFPATATASVLADGGIMIEATFMLDMDVRYPIAWVAQFSKANFSQFVQDAQAVLRDTRPIEIILQERITALRGEVDAMAEQNPEIDELREGLAQARREYRASLS